LPKVFVEEVDLRRFRGVKECREPVRLSGFTVLVGRKNSGKTAVLEALAFLPLPDNAHRLPFLGDIAKVIGTLHGSLSSLVYGYSGRPRFAMSSKGGGF